MTSPKYEVGSSSSLLFLFFNCPSLLVIEVHSNPELKPDSISCLLACLQVTASFITRWDEREAGILAVVEEVAASHLIMGTGDARGRVTG